MAHPYRRTVSRPGAREGIPGPYVVGFLAALMGVVIVAAMLASGRWGNLRGASSRALLPVGAPVR